MSLRRLAIVTCIAVLTASFPATALAAPQAPRGTPSQSTPWPPRGTKPAGCNVATAAKGRTSFARCFAV
ncbi:MAG: hypothetical protein LBV60_05810, partial [Streptomyces sp.]|nr:hypothetical protein [Streptomyces sp.]